MNAAEDLVLHGLKLSIDKLAFEIAQYREEAALKSKHSDLAEWLTLEQAIALKGGTSLATYRQKPFLQPCCGKNYRLVGGRRCWRRNDVLEWIGITDDNGLVAYARDRGVELPKVYQRRGEK
jgi:hypothetical protein